MTEIILDQPMECLKCLKKCLENVSRKIFRKVSRKIFRKISRNMHRKISCLEICL